MSLLVTTAASDRNVYLSARNIAGVERFAGGRLERVQGAQPRRMLVTRAAPRRR